MDCAEEDKDETTLAAREGLHSASGYLLRPFLHRYGTIAPGTYPGRRLSELLAFDYEWTRAIHSELFERGAVPEQLPACAIGCGARIPWPCP